MAKPPSIASIVRAAAVSEAAFIETVLNVLETEEMDRIIEIFGRLNVPKVFTEVREAPELADIALNVTDFTVEGKLAEGFNTYIDRHTRKLKWHTTHPSEEGPSAAVGIYRVGTLMTAIRIKRVVLLLTDTETLSAKEWGLAREFINRGFRDLREYSKLLVNSWLPATVEVVDQEILMASAEGLGEVLRGRARLFKSLREDLESKRLDLSVLPVGYPPVKPPRYFGGDLMEEGAWKLYWGEMGALADTLSQALEN